MYEIRAALRSPLMIGGKTLNSNYRESRDYIPGSVLRAAYAKAIIQRCAYEQKNYWLEYKGQSSCETCGFQAVCKNFTKLAFPTLYPMGARPYPLTAREKKYKDKNTKGVFDILKIRLSQQKKAAEESTWKRLDGFQKDGTRVRLLHSAITRTAIDYKRNAAKEGALYTQNVIAEKYLSSEDILEDVIFSAETNLLPEEVKELSKIKILHIGADITRGFGKCHIMFKEANEEDIKEDTPEKILKRIQEFNIGMDPKKFFVILDLLTDAYLGLEEIGTDSMSQTEITDEQMRAFLSKLLPLSHNKYELYRVFKTQEVLRGFDTSKDSEKKMRRRSRLVIKAGAVFVYQACLEDINEEELWHLEKQGIGSYTEHGFGKIRICDEFHTKYDVLKGDKLHESSTKSND